MRIAMQSLVGMRILIMDIQYILIVDIQYILIVDIQYNLIVDIQYILIVDIQYILIVDIQYIGLTCQKIMEKIDWAHQYHKSWWWHFTI